MRKSSKVVSLLLSGLMATSCFTTASLSVSAAEADEATGAALTYEERLAAGHQLVKFQYPSVWDNGDGKTGNAKVKYNSRSHKTNICCNFYAIANNTTPVKVRAWEAPSTNCYKDSKDSDIYYFDITESGQGVVEENADYGILFSANFSTSGGAAFQTCDLYFNSTCLGDTYHVNVPAATRENTATSEKQDYLGYSDNGVGLPIKKVTTLCSYVDGIYPTYQNHADPVAEALKNYLSNPVNEPSFTYKKLVPVMEAFGVQPIDVYNSYIRLYADKINSEDVTKYVHQDGVDDLKADGTLKDVYRKSYEIVEEVDEATGEPKPTTVNYPDIDLVMERLNLTEDDVNPQTDEVIANVEANVGGAVLNAGKAVPTVSAPADVNYTIESAVWSPAATTFDYNTQYTLTVTFAANEGYVFDETTTYPIGGLDDGSADVTTNGSIVDGKLVATYTFTTDAKTVINNVEANVNGAVLNATNAVPTVAAPAGVNYTVESAVWAPADETFAYGTEYTLTVTFAANEGYEFNTDTTSPIAGLGEGSAEITSGSSLTDGKLVATYTFTTDAEPVPEDSYVVAGTPADVFGTTWDETNEANAMTKDGDVFTKTFTVDKAFKDIQLKVVRNGLDWIGDETGNNVTFDMTAAGDFTVTFDPATEKITVTGDNVKFNTDLVFNTVFAAGNGEGYWLNGAAWDPGYAANEMTEVSDGIWEIRFDNVPEGFDRQIKFAIDGAWTHNFGMGADPFDLESMDGEWIDAEYNGSNITFDTEDTIQSVVAKLDMRNFDFTTKTGAKMMIDVIYSDELDDDVVGIIGDVDNDGQVTISDATLIQRRGIELETFTETQDKLADVNGDGRISVLDATCVQKYVAEYTTGTGNAGAKLKTDGTIVPAN